MSSHGMSSSKASQVKRGGHLREQVFSNQFSSNSMMEINTNVNFSGSSADCFINKEDYLYIVTELGAKNGSTSVKGGSTYQFHLGKIPELIDYESLTFARLPSSKNPAKLETRFHSNIDHNQQKEVLSSYSFWRKYLGKGEILALDVNNVWHFFLMRDVLNLLIDPHWVRWRFLDTGRIKGDLLFQSGKKRTGITFEHRFEKNQSVIGAHGGKSGVEVFFPWLLDHLQNHIEVSKMTV